MTPTNLLLGATVAAIAAVAVTRRRKKDKASGGAVSQSACLSWKTPDGTTVNVYQAGATISPTIVADLAGGIDASLVVNIAPDMQDVAYEAMLSEILEHRAYGGNLKIVEHGLNMISPNCDWKGHLAFRSGAATTPTGKVIEGALDLAAAAAAKAGVA